MMVGGKLTDMATKLLTRKRVEWKRLTVIQREVHLRSRATPEELKLKALLMADVRTRGRFAFQAHLLGYFPDFLFRASRLIVELDGSVHSSKRAQLMDRRRTRKLTAAGYRVIRFWNSELRNEQRVVEAIVSHLEPQPVIEF